MKDWFKYLKQPRTLAITIAVVVVLAIMIPTIILLQNSAKAETSAGTGENNGGIISLVTPTTVIQPGATFEVRITADTRGEEVYEIGTTINSDFYTFTFVSATYPNSTLWPEVFHESTYPSFFTIRRSVPKNSDGSWPEHGQKGTIDLAIATFRAPSKPEPAIGTLNSSNTGCYPSETYYTGSGLWSCGFNMSISSTLAQGHDIGANGLQSLYDGGYSYMLGPGGIYGFNYLAETDSGSDVTVAYATASTSDSSSASSSTTSSNMSSTTTTPIASAPAVSQAQTYSQSEPAPLSDSGPEMIVWYGASTLAVLCSTLTFRRWKD